jgi:hypothetical protein
MVKLFEYKGKTEEKSKVLSRYDKGTDKTCGGKIEEYVYLELYSSSLGFVFSHIPSFCNILPWSSLSIELHTC